MSFQKHVGRRFILWKGLLFAFLELFKLEEIDFSLLCWLVLFKSWFEDLELLGLELQLLLLRREVLNLLVIWAATKKWNDRGFFGRGLCDSGCVFNGGSLDSLREFNFTFQLLQASHLLQLFFQSFRIEVVPLWITFAVAVITFIGILLLIFFVKGDVS